MTSQDGAFAFDGLPASELTLRARGAKGFIRVEGGVALPEDVAPTTIRLQATRTRSGEVRDAAGKPVSGAYVTVDGEWFTQTDAAGSFTTSGFPVGEGQVEVAVVAPDRSRMLMRLADGEKPLRFTFEGADSLTIHARGSRSRRPIAGARAAVAGGHLEGAVTESDWFGSDYLVHGTTDADGVVTLTGLDLTRLNFWTIDAPGIGWTGGVFADPRDGPRTPRSITVDAAVARARSVEGRLLDDWGRPIAGAEMVPLEYGRDALRRVTTDRDGRFAIPAAVRLPGVRLGLVVWSDSPQVDPDDGQGGSFPILLFAPGFGSPLARDGLTFTAGPDPLVVEVRVPRGARVDGRLLDEAGRPVADSRVVAAVGWETDEMAHSPSECRCLARDDGTFSLVDVPPGPVTFHVEGEAWTDSVEPFALAARERRNVGDVRVTRRP